jgi:hypothetical protein
VIAHVDHEQRAAQTRLVQLGGQEADRASRVPVASVGWEDRVADVGLAGLEPRRAEIGVDPADHVAVDLDARCRRRIRRARAEPTLALFIALVDDEWSVADRERPQGDDTVTGREHHRPSLAPTRRVPTLRDEAATIGG